MKLAQNQFHKVETRRTAPLPTGFIFIVFVWVRTQIKGVCNVRRTTDGRPYIVPPSPKQVILSGVARYYKRKRHKTKNRHAVELYFCVLAKIKRFRHNMAKTGSTLRFCCLCLNSLFFGETPGEGFPLAYGNSPFLRFWKG